MRVKKSGMSDYQKQMEIVTSFVGKKSVGDIVIDTERNVPETAIGNFELGASSHECNGIVAKCRSDSVGYGFIRLSCFKITRGRPIRAGFKGQIVKIEVHPKQVQSCRNKNQWMIPKMWVPNHRMDEFFVFLSKTLTRLANFVDGRIRYVRRHFSTNDELNYLHVDAINMWLLMEMKFEGQINGYWVLKSDDDFTTSPLWSGNCDMCSKFPGGFSHKFNTDRAMCIVSKRDVPTASNRRWNKVPNDRLSVWPLGGHHIRKNAMKVYHDMEKQLENEYPGYCFVYCTRQSSKHIRYELFGTLSKDRVCEDFDHPLSYLDWHIIDKLIKLVHSLNRQKGSYFTENWFDVMLPLDKVYAYTNAGAWLCYHLYIIGFGVYPTVVDPENMTTDEIRDEVNQFVKSQMFHVIAHFAMNGNVLCDINFYKRIPFEVPSNVIWCERERS